MIYRPCYVCASPKDLWRLTGKYVCTKCHQKHGANAIYAASGGTKFSNKEEGRREGERGKEGGRERHGCINGRKYIEK